MSNTALFGGRVRAETMETLALTSRPLTAYRVANVIGAEPIQVLTTLKSLGPEIVRHTDAGWVLVSDALRLYLRETCSRRESELRQEKDELLVGLGRKPRSTRGRS
jgi:hypothetical protein